MSCLKLTIEYDTYGQQISTQNVAGQINGYDYWVFNYGGEDLYIFWVGGRWFGSKLLDISGARVLFQSNDTCPEAVLGSTSGTDWIDMGIWVNLVTFTTECVPCPEPNCDQEDRKKVSFNSVKLPTDFVEQDRGIKDCCCKYFVLCDPGSDTWKNDITSAWVKVSDPSDTFAFKLYKDGALSSFTPTPQAFPNDTDAYYTTINWMDVFNADGSGCYELKIEYSISGIVGETTWGEYQLSQYSIKNALKTARIRAIFNGFQEVQGINFTGAQVESTFRFFGYIGNRQPNMETDNIIYGNREMKRVIRENLNSYQIVTEPTDECITRPLIDLFLLSENELYISDYNAHNHSYRYEDLPVIVSESPEIEYYDLSRKAKVTAIVTDKFKNKRTYYK